MPIRKLCAICISLAGCASYPQPTENLASSAGAVRGAEEAGAEKLPDAALHLRLAQEQNDHAKQLMDDGDNERAAYLLERARADAELALALAHQDRARKQAQQASLSTTPQPQSQPQSGPEAQPMAPATTPEENQP